MVPSQDAYRAALARAYREAGARPDAVTLIEGNGSGDPCEDGVELEALGGARRKAPSALASVKASVGHAGAAGGMASLLKAVLCLRDEVIPSLPEGGGPRSDLPESLRIPYRAEYWLRNRAQGPRRCAVSAMSVDGTCSCAILEGFDAPEAQARPAVPRPLVPVDTGLFIVEGENDHILLENIGKLRQLAADFQGPHIYDLGLAWHRLNVSMPSRRKRIAFLSRDIPEILRFIELAVHSLFENPDRPIGRDGRGTFQDVDTDRIFYEPAPLGPACSTAFVLPGSGNHYPGMGRALAAAWSGIMHVQDRENGFLKDQMLPEYFWRLDSLDSVRDNHLALIFGQVTLGTVACDILRSFGFTPDAVLGYSLGESAGLFARRAWKDRDEMLRRMRNSPLFTEELSGPCRAAKRAWGMPDRSRVQWSVGVVDVPSDVVRKALVGRDRVYLLIVNTPDECVIGGERKAVGRLVKDLGCAFVPIEGVTAVHCDVVKAVRDEYRELHLFDTTPPEGTAFYSAAWGRRYTLTSGSAADSILAQALEGLDFTGLINTAYNDGIHIFVELGPGGSCTRMIDKILGDRPHLARAVCIPGSDEVLTLLSTVGALAAHNIPVDLSAFYPPDLSIPSIPSQARRIIVETGGLPFDERRKTTDEAAEPPESPHPTAPSKAEPSVAVRPERPGGPLPVTDNMEMESLPRTAPARISTGAPVYATPPGEIGVDTMKRLVSAQEASSQAHEAYLAFSRNLSDVYSRNLAFQMALLEAAGADLPEISQLPICALDEDRIDRLPARPALTREQCIEFATGSMARVLGEEFAAVDSHPTRVRLPDEPLMLADRILLIEGEPRSLTTGRVVTEHDILPDAWYLDANRIPTCIAVEAGQADLFLSGYLGIDFVTKGLAVYRLLDAIVTFHRSLPGPGTVVRYDIRIDHFFRQGDTWLFRFRFDATIMGEPLLTMRGGCAGFFTERELEEGRGIVHTDLDRRPMTGKRPPDWEILVPMRSESYGAAQLDALRRGDLAGCFGHSFLGLDVSRPLTIPGGRMKLVDRVVRLDPEGGRFGIGVITAESDIHPDDWFLTCHFLDDQVMPGTLMYECCLHTLRIFLLRMGWVADENASVWEPVPGIASRLKCRGQVIPPTLVAAYEITLKEIGYGPEPYAIADALMYADGRPIVEITDMSVRLSGLTRKSLEALWERSGTGISPGAQGEIPQTRDGARTPSSGARIDALRAFGAGMRSVLTGTASSTVSKAAIFDHDRILAFATGKPSEAFGDRYRVFDEERVIARLPGPPYQFLDRITSIRGGEQWVMVPGTVIEAQYDVPEDGWYFDADRQEQMPYTVLLEVALQPCGWLAAYLGSALTSDVDLSFRNLGGSAVQHAPVTRRTGTLTTEVKITSVSKSGGMIIQHYAFSVRSGGGPVYEGTTYFGFFSKEALADQVGIKDPQPWSPSDEECARGTGFPYPTGSPFPDDRLRMIDFIECSTMDGGPKGLGFSRGLFHIDKEAWFFKAHFYQDPVIPGSLGLESLLQLMKLAAFRRWGGSPLQQFEAAVPGVRHEWVYRGQVIPDDRQVTVDMWVTSADDSRRILTADGFLSVDGRLVYKMNDFSLRAAK
jgi:acyl transferase domain-containing protein/3-hydroxymyristoyl/3-hydroxydecanoyl-(acyl carrier protein) dehydratase